MGKETKSNIGEQKQERATHNQTSPEVHDAELKQKDKSNGMISRFSKRREFGILAVLLAIVLVAIVLLQAWYTFIGHKPKFCYVHTGKLNCVSENGKYHARYNLPKPDNRELTSLIPSPNQSHYLALSSGITGLSQDTPTFWVLDNKLTVVKKIDLKQDPNNTFNRLFAVWSPDSKTVLVRGSTGYDALYSYSIETEALHNLSATGDSLQPFEDCNDIGYYGFSSDNRVVVTCGIDGESPEFTSSKIVTMDTDGKNVKTIANNDRVYSGSYTATKSGPIVYHDGNKIYAVNTDGTSKRQLASNVDFSFSRYDWSSDTLFLVKKDQNDKGWTLGVKTIAYATIADLLNGKQPIVANVNSDIHTEGTSYLTPINGTEVALSGLNGSKIYDFVSGKSFSLSPAPLVIPGDASSNLEGITGLLPTTNFFNWNPFHQKETTADRIRDINKASRSFRHYIAGEFKKQDSQCQQNPDRYGSQLDMKVVGVQGNSAAVVVSCRITGYWGKEGSIILYQKVGKNWTSLESATGYYWPSCDVVNKYHFTNKIIPTCDTGGASYKQNTNP